MPQVTIIQPHNPGEAGPDYRMLANDRRSHPYHTSIWQRGPGAITAPASPMVEAQGFRSIAGGASVVGVSIHSPEGMADIILSPSEARLFGRMLLRAADDIDSIDGIQFGV